MGRRRGNRKRQRNGGGGRPPFRGGGMVQFQSTNDTIIERGHEIFSSLSTTASAGLFAGAVSVNLTLKNISDRLGALGQLYERWQLLKLVVTFFPVVGTGTAGAISIGVLDDTADNIAVSTDTSFTAVASMRSSMQTQAYEKASFTWIPRDRSKMYYTDANGATGTSSLVRFAAPCSIFGLGNTTPINSNTAFGYLRFDYVVKFSGAVTPTAITRDDKDKVDARPPPVLFDRGLGCFGKSTVGK